MDRGQKGDFWLAVWQTGSKAGGVVFSVFNQSDDLHEQQWGWFKSEEEVGQRENEVGSEKSQFKCTFRRKECDRFLQIQYVQSNTAAGRKLSTYQLLRLSIFTYRYTINKHSAADWEPVCKTSLSKTSNSETISLTNCWLSSFSWWKETRTFR